jgi:hypothetical protein
MNEMERLQRLRSEVPASLPVAHAENALLTAIRAETARPAAAPGGLARRARAGRGLPRRRAGVTAQRRTRLAMAGGLSLAVAAGVTATLAVQAGGSPAAAGLTVRELAYRTAAVAGAQPAVPPGQWVYWREKTVGGKPAGVFQVWTTADGRRAAYVYRGKVHFIKPPLVPLMRHGAVVLRHGRPVMRPAGQFIAQPDVFVLPHGQGVTYGLQNGTVPISYAGLSSLPRSPRALDNYLSQLRLPGWGPASFQAFEVIKELLTTYVMPPGLTAELYRALADLPGITVDNHAVDVAGRPGVGFAMAIPPSAGGGKDEIIINSRNYHLMGQEFVHIWGPDSRVRVLSGTAILRTALVAGPGVLP